MSQYRIVEVLEKKLEDLIRQDPDLIEEGLTFITHQFDTKRGPLDVLLADSGNALIVAELKATEDDNMLTQGMDYYDFVASNIESLARGYKDAKINPLEDPRLLLIAPSFSQTLINRCKWIDIPISLFEYQCIVFDNNPDKIIPVFKQKDIPSRPEIVDVPTIPDYLNYITDNKIKKIAENFLNEIKLWDESNISLIPIKYAISIKVSGRVFAHFSTRRKHFVISTYDSDNNWKNHQIKDKDYLETVKTLLKKNFEAIKQ